MNPNPTGPELITERLLLRRWRVSDLDAFAEMNADRRVREYFPKTLTIEESKETMEWIEKHFEERGFGFWAIEVINGPPLIGFTGLSVPSFQADFTPCVEIGWRLAFPFWRKGYATEAARAALEYGFSHLNLNEIVAMAVAANTRSRAVMERLGMRHEPNGDFEHPGIEEGHWLRRHVLYRITRQEFIRSAKIQ